MGVCFRGVAKVYVSSHLAEDNEIFFEVGSDGALNTTDNQSSFGVTDRGSQLREELKVSKRLTFDTTNEN